jgi:hypothetical protein
MNALRFPSNSRQGFGPVFCALLALAALLTTPRVQGAIALQFYTQPSFAVSSSGTWGQNINLSLSVINVGTTPSGSFSVSVYLSPTSTYNASTAYPWLAGGYAISFSSLSQNFYAGNTLAVLLPQTVPSGRGWDNPGTNTVYVIAIISQNSASSVVSTRLTTLPANLQFYSQPSYGVSSSGIWGQTINLALSVLNNGNASSGNFSVSVYLSPTPTYNASTAYPWLAGSSAISCPPITGGGYITFNQAVSLPSTVPSGLGSGQPGVNTVYVIAIISQNGVSAAASTQITTPAPDLIGYNSKGYSFGVQQSSATWSQTVGVEFAVFNQTAGTAGPFTVNVYLSETPNFGSGNVPGSNTYYLGSFVQSSGLAGGYIGATANVSGGFGYDNFLLPNSNPFGDGNTSFYIGMVINPSTHNTLTPITEGNYANDCNQGQGIDYAPISITGQQPKIAVSGSNPAGSQNTLQFGNINLGQTSTQTITISDTGTANLQINNVSATGPFAVTKVVSSIQTLSAPYFPGTIAPNDEENWVVTVTYTPTAASQQTGTLTVTSNDPNTPTINFALSGTGLAVSHLVLTNPVPSNNDNLIANYGGVADNASESETFILSNSGTAPLTISQNGITLTTTQSGAWSVVSITSSTQGAINLSSSSGTIAANRAETWSLVAKFMPTANQGYATGLQIFSNDPSTPTTPGSPTLTCALQGQGLVPMTISVVSAVNGVNDSNPLVMNFGSVHATGQQKVTGMVTLTNTGQMPLVIPQNGIALGSGANFQVTGITSSTQGAINLSGGSSTIAAKSTEIWTINLVFQPTVAGNDNTVLTISSNDPANGTESIALNGTGLNQPGIVITTPQGGTILAFGPVLNDGAGNHIGKQTFTIQNLGLQPLVISANGISLVNAPGYSIQSIVSSTHGTINLASGSATIAAKQTETWTVTAGLHPASNTSYSGTLNIASNDPATPTASLALSGSGTTPTLVLQPTTGTTTILCIQAGQVYNINWAATDNSDTSASATLTLSTAPTNSLPASGLTTIATMPYNSTQPSH